MSIVQTKKNGFEGRRVWFVFAALAALLTAVGLFVILGQVTATSTYYVLNQDVPARTQISETMLTEVVTSKGGEPKNAIGLAEVLSEPVFAKYELNSGDILTASNAGSLEPIDEGIPDDFVVATFTAPASQAAGGKIQRGSYVDLISIRRDSEGNTVGTYFLQHVLVLDATIDLDSVAAAATENSDGTTTNAADSPAVRSGVPTLYTVGLLPTDAAKLAIATQEIIYVVLSADQSSDGIITDINITVDLSSLEGVIGNSGKGTDNTFGKGGVVNNDEDSNTDNGTTSTPTPNPTETPVVENPTIPNPTETPVDGGLGG